MTSPSPTPPVTFTVEEVAAKWRCNPWTVYRLVERGQLGAFRIGRRIRIPQSALDAFEAQ